MSDPELVTRFLRRRDEATFDEIYARHTPYLYRVALRMLDGRQDEAQDAIQEAWIRAVRALPRFRGDSSLRTWLCGIAMNCCRERWRLRPPINAVELETADLRVTGDSDPLAAARLQRAIVSLDETGRLAIELHDVLGHTHEEIAVILGIAPGTSKSRLFRARETLRSLLATHGSARTSR